MEQNDRVIRTSPFTVKETIDRLSELLIQIGITIYARIDQQEEAAKKGITLGALEFILFGDPQKGGRIMAENPAAGLDLPLKVLAWEDHRQRTWIIYNEPTYIGDRFLLSNETARLTDLEPLMAALLKS